jgi:putative addiction module component (TIGR02574 family)
MIDDIKSIAAAARNLPPEDQADLIDELVTSLGRTDGDWNAAWSKEAERRWAQHAASQHSGHATEDVLSDIAKLLNTRRQRS